MVLWPGANEAIAIARMVCDFEAGIALLDLKCDVYFESPGKLKCYLQYSTDLFEELRYLYRISRVLGGTHTNIELDAKEMLKMITINAARSFKLDKIMGSIEIGKNADFSLIDLNHPNFFSFEIEFNNISSLIVQRTKSENIKKTYIKGDLAFERN